MTFTGSPAAIAAALTIAGAALAPDFAAATTFRTLALSGDAAPGTGGATFSGFFGAPALNNGGETAFLGALAGPGVDSTNNDGVFTSSALVARKGDAASGTGGATFSAFIGSPALNDGGETAFVSGLAGTGVDSTNDSGLFTSSGLVARAGDAAPGTGGGTFAGFFPAALNNDGETAFRGALAGAGVDSTNDRGVFTSSTLVTFPALVAREGDVAPGTGGATFSRFGPSALNDGGETAFQGILAGAGVDLTNSSGLFRTGATGLLEQVLREGDLFHVGGDLRTVSALGFATGGFNDDGDLAFFAGFNDGSSGIFVAAASDPLSAVPLPPAFALLLTGLVGLGFAGRRRARMQ